MTGFYGDGTPFVSSGETNTGEGGFGLFLPDAPGSFEATLDLSTAGGGTIISPQQVVAFQTTDTNTSFGINWVVETPNCPAAPPPGACWMTGGGVKFSTVTGTYLAEHGPQQNFGGNVYPSCSSEPGEGGQWNHVDHDAQLHFQGRAIVVDECGNIEGIPPGSTSPETPFNYIEYHGTGTLKGIKGNKADYGTVCFEARVEDRSEPGSGGQRNFIQKDRYYLRVTDCGGNTLLVLEDPAAPGASQPVTITGGNLQIHTSSCGP